MSTTDTRAAFEAWASRQDNWFTVYRDSSGQYQEREADAAWEAWQAATEAAKATGTAGELPPLPEEIEVGGEGWGWEDFQSEKTFSVEHMLHYGAACAQAAFAEAARQPAPALPVKTWQERLKEGGWEDYTAMLAEIADLRAAMAATAAPVLTSAKINEIYQRTHKHCYDGAAAGNFLREYIAATNRSQP